MSDKMGIETPMYQWLNVSSMGVTTRQQQLSFPWTSFSSSSYKMRTSLSATLPSLRFIIPASLNVPFPPPFSLFDKDETIVLPPIKASTAGKNNSPCKWKYCSVSQFSAFISDLRGCTQIAYYPILFFAVMKFKIF